MQLLVAIAAVLLGAIHEIAVLFVKPTLANLVIGAAVMLPGVAMLKWRRSVWPTIALAASCIVQAAIFFATFPVAMAGAALISLTVQGFRNRRFVVGALALVATISFATMVQFVYEEQLET